MLKQIFYLISIKLGVIDDSANRSRLAKLLQFQSSAEKGLVSLAEYVERMKEKQDTIYFIAGSSLDEVKRSPFVERLVKKGYEVLYLTEAVDEYCISALPDFEGKKFQNVAKEGVELDEGESGKAKLDMLKTQFEPLTNWLAETALKDQVNIIFGYQLAIKTLNYTWYLFTCSFLRNYEPLRPIFKIIFASLDI